MRESQWYVIRKLDVQICLCFIEPVPLLVVAAWACAVSKWAHFSLVWTRQILLERQKSR